MELKINEAKTVRPNHLERCLCYDKFLKGYRCYVYDDISKYWCTQATTEHDPNGDNHIVDYADYQVTKWASLQQEQPEVDLEREIRDYFSKWGYNIYNGAITMDNGIVVTLSSIQNVARHFWNKGYNARKED